MCSLLYIYIIYKKKETYKTVLKRGHFRYKTPQRREWHGGHRNRGDPPVDALFWCKVPVNVANKGVTVSLDRHGILEIGQNSPERRTENANITGEFHKVGNPESDSRSDFRGKGSAVMAKLRYVKCVACGKVDAPCKDVVPHNVGTATVMHCSDCDGVPATEWKPEHRYQGEPATKCRACCPTGHGTRLDERGL